MKPFAEVVDERLTLRVPEVAQLLGCSRDTVLRLIATKDLPSIRLGRVILVPRKALEEWLERETSENPRADDDADTPPSSAPHLRRKP